MTSSGTFQNLRPSSAFWLTAGTAAALVLLGLAGAHHMESEGHYVTGMNNRVVWGLPHVFAVFLIVSASGALNVASIASVFRQSLYKPLSRISGLLAMALLVGGLTVLLMGNAMKEVLTLVVKGQASLVGLVKAFALLIPFVISFSLPMGLLTTMLLVFGRFSADQELIAARAGGVPI